MDFEETFDETSSEANFEMNLSDLEENKVNRESPVFDSDTDDVLISVPEQVVNGENIQIQSVSNSNESDVENILPPPRKTSKSDLLQYIDKGWNKNTKDKTDRDVRRFTDFLKVRGETRPIENLPRSDLDTQLGAFFMDLKKANGETYEPGTITSIHRYL